MSYAGILISWVGDFRSFHHLGLDMPALENLFHETFAHQFLADCNGTQAYMRCKPDCSSEAVAGTEAWRLLKIPEIQRRIRELHEEAMKDVGISIRMVLQELHRIAGCDVGQAFNEDRSLKKINEIPEDVRRCISGIEVEEIWSGGKDNHVIGELVKIKFWDKNKGLELLGKHFKMFTDKVEHGADSSLRELVMGSMAPKQP